MEPTMQQPRADHQTPAAPGPTPEVFGLSFRYIAIFWTLVIVGLAGWDYHQTTQAARENARTAALHSFGKDLTFRRWATRHGGVYVPVTEQTPPNPYLTHVLERDITTPSGRQLTLVNPAYMMRQLHQSADELFGIRGHITSLKPLRPENAPDAWEAEGLRAFAGQVEEWSSMAELEGATYLRLMRPLIAEEGCIKCHSRQGYAVGDVLGGLSVAIPWAPYRSALLTRLPGHLLAYSGLWLLGMGFLGHSSRRLRSHWLAQQASERTLRLERRRLQNILDGTQVGTWEWNIQSGATVFNQRWAEIVGYRLAELEPVSIDTWLRLAHPEDLQRSNELLQRHFAGELPFYECEARIKHKDGHWVWVADRGQVLEWSADGRPLMMYGTQKDITARKQAEAALRQRTLDLEERSAELERFNYTVSHDLKSPLVTVKSFLGFLEQDLALQDTERIHTDLDYIRTATNKMSRLLDELLEMSRIGRLSNPSVEVTFDDLIQEVLALMAGPIAERGVRVEADGQGQVLFGDRPRLVEIWQNLVENAVKYMGEQAAPRIEIGLERQPQEVVFFVRDNGIGIDQRFQGKIFNLFEKLDQTSEGSGLGLALVKRLVELYGGRIWAESAGPGQGSCLWFTLPAALGGEGGND